MTNNIKTKIGLFFLGALMLIGGCSHRYCYKYKNLESWAVSDQAGESKIRTYSIESIPPDTIPELMVMLDGKEIYLRQSLTKSEVLDFIKRNEIRYMFSTNDPLWRELKTPYEADKVDITLCAQKSGYLKLYFSKQTFMKWSVLWGDNGGFKIASPKNKKYYSMPITVLQMKEIFGEPLKSMSGLSIK